MRLWDRLRRRRKPQERRGLTTDRNDPRLGYGVDESPIPQHDVYLVMPEDERAKGFVRPVRKTYIHKTCGAATTMSLALAETYAREPRFYGATYCCKCGMHKAVSEFEWEDGTGVGS